MRNLDVTLFSPQPMEAAAYDLNSFDRDGPAAVAPRLAPEHPPSVTQVA
jgi:hypothetical protein